MASLKAVVVMLLAGLLICGAGADGVAGQQQERTAESCERCKTSCNGACADEASGKCRSSCNPDPWTGAPPSPGSCDSCKNSIVAQCSSECPVKCILDCPPPTAEECSKCNQEKCVDGTCSGVAGGVCQGQGQCKGAGEETAVACEACKKYCFQAECVRRLGCPSQ